MRLTSDPLWLTFECTKNGHYKFWHCSVCSEEQSTYAVKVKYGKIGTTGCCRVLTDRFFTATAASNRAQSLIAEKRKKGYVETTPPFYAMRKYDSGFDAYKMSRGRDVARRHIINESPYYKEEESFLPYTLIVSKIWSEDKDWFHVTQHRCNNIFKLQIDEMKLSKC